MPAQLVVLVTRPILLCCLELLLQDPIEASHLVSSAKVRHLISVSSEAAQNMSSILSSLQEQGLLDTFLPWDFDALFVSTTVLILIRGIDGTLLAQAANHSDSAFVLFEYMAVCGNDVAAHRIRELRALEAMLGAVSATSAPPVVRHDAVVYVENSSQQGCAISSDEHVGPTADGVRVGFHSSGVASLTIPTDSSGLGLDLTAEQILAMADGMDIEETDWMSLLTSELG